LIVDGKSTDVYRTYRLVRSITTPIPLIGIPLNKIVKEKEEESLNIYKVLPITYRIFIKRPSIEVFIIYLHEIEE